jgi:hypothetical protein
MQPEHSNPEQGAEKAPKKIYHAPVLTEWGTLQNVTQGPGDGIEDFDDGSTFDGL